MRKAAFHNLGCKVNSYETEAMEQLLEKAGYEIVPFSETADVYVINTCSVTNIADRKSRQMLHRAKKNNPDAVVVAAGCYVQAAGEELKRDPSVDIIIGNNKKAELPGILEDYFAERESRETVIDISCTREYEALRIEKIEEHTRAFLKVQDGCNQFCSYCIIPYTRGRARSRAVGEILAEVRTLAAAGYREMVLTGIHLSSYGIDMPAETRTDLTGLIRKLHEVEGLERIRLGSLEPRIVTEEFVSVLSGLPKVCPHFHLSLQSGCDDTLKRMNRRYTAEEYENACRLLRKGFSDPAITTDVIVGFPGETKEEFETTAAFLRKIGFYEMHVFKYSRRQGTKAAVMENQVSEQEKSRRSDVLIELGKEMSRQYRASFLGRQTEILLEEEQEIGGQTYLTGYTREYVKAAVPAAGQKKGEMAAGRLDSFLTEEILLLTE